MTQMVLLERNCGDPNLLNEGRCVDQRGDGPMEAGSNTSTVALRIVRGD
jgi:hypothetical protein